MNKLVFAVFLAAIVSSSLGASLNNVIQLLQSFSDSDGLGNYRYSFEQSDETKQEQTGTLRNAGGENPFVAVQGFYLWRAPEGDLYRVDYTADENGYQPKVSGGPGALPPAATASLLG